MKQIVSLLLALITKIRCLPPFRADNKPLVFFSFAFGVFLLMTHLTIYITPPIVSDTKVGLTRAEAKTHDYNSPIQQITGFIKEGETLSDITKKYNLKTEDMLSITKASRRLHDLKSLKPWMSYRILIDRDSNNILQLKYSINDSSYISATRDSEEAFDVEKVSLSYEKKTGIITGTINNNLIESLGSDKEHVNIAFELADIFAYDIDFTTDLRKGDKFQILVEELYRGGVFKGYGKILYAKFVNDGTTYELFGYTIGKQNEYYKPDGTTNKKTLMRAPLRYRYISSFFSKSRAHPILKISRPHYGVDYVAPKGTPISAAGDGTVVTAGYSGGFGNRIVVRHANGYESSYGHLSAFKKGLRKGSIVSQGEIIGYVGSTGLSTGPHLDYRITLAGQPLNPLNMKLPNNPIASGHKNAYLNYVANMRKELDKSITTLNIERPEEVKTRL